VHSKELTQSQCDSACDCTCHRRNRFRSPSFLNAVLGSLFVGYQASPWSAQECNSRVCQRRSSRITYTYAFPQWLLNRVLFCNIAYSNSNGPELCLKVVRIRPDHENIFHRLISPRVDEKGFLGRIEDLMNEGQASVLDVSASGWTVLHVRQSSRDRSVTPAKKPIVCSYALQTPIGRILDSSWCGYLL
jgi:hypothetical protein